MSTETWSALAEFGMVFVTAVYTVATIFIWKATRDNTEATRQVLEAAHRPYVSVSVKVAGEGHKGYQITTTLVNTGNVPARSVRVVTLVTPGDPPTTQYASAETELVLFKGISQPISRPLRDHELPFAHATSNYRAYCYVTYKGMTEQEYSSEASYSCDGLNGITMVAGRFT